MNENIEDANAGPQNQENTPVEQSVQDTGNSIDTASQSEFAERARSDMEAFVKAYPNVEELPGGVIERIVKEGITPVEAYQGYLLELKDLEIERLKNQNLMRSNTPGSALGEQPAYYDAFLNEFAND